MSAILELPTILVEALRGFNFTGKPLWRLGEGLNHMKVELTFKLSEPEDQLTDQHLVCRNVSRKLTLMKLLSKYVNQNSLKQYYNSYVLPVFDFGCVVWGHTTNANLTRLVKLQKRAARMILKADFMTPSEQLFKELNWLPFPKRVQYHTCLMVYKSITGQAPEYISSMLTYVSEHHERQTRSTVLDLLHIPRSHSAYLTEHFQFKVQNYGKVYQRILETAHQSIGLNAN